MMMEAAAVGWGAQVLGGYHSTSDGYCGYAALELPIADPAQPNALLEGYGSTEIRK